MVDPRSTQAIHIRRLLDQADWVVNERLARLMAETTSVKGDFEGHPFRGNQWTGGGSIGDDDPRTGSVSPSESYNQAWRDNLTNDQKEAIDKYTSGGYRELNEKLREGKELTGDNKKLAQNLDSAIDSSPEFDQPVIVYRGINIGDSAIAPHGRELAMMGQHEHDAAVRKYVDDYASEKFLPGDTITVKSFQSTSFNIEPALDASISKKAPGIIFEIRAHKGAYLNGISRYDDENELLLSRHTKYRVVKVIKSAKFESFDSSTKRTIVQVEQI